ncbi:MAG: ABC transporter substrate-binding protein [Ilumatobacteraceae bacterium]
MFRWRRAFALPAVALLALGACGGDDDDTTLDATTTPLATDAPATTPAAETTLASPSTEAAMPVDIPTKIVSLYPTGTEMLFAIGADDQVIAVDDQSNYPDGAVAKQTDLSGFAPNVEAIAAYEPDLVVHDGTTDIGTQLDAVGIPQWAGPAAEDFDDIYQQLEQLGALTGHVAEAAELVAQMETDVDTAIAAIPPSDTPLSYYHELDSTLFSVTSNTFIGQVYSLFDLRNIADTTEAGTDYPQLNAEFVISQDPDLIFLADADFGESPETVAARPGWETITAVQRGSVIPVNTDIASRWGPRIVEFIEIVSDAIATASVAG